MSEARIGCDTIPTRIKVGCYIKIIDPYVRYSAYRDFFLHYKLNSGWLTNFKETEGLFALKADDIIYKVLFIGIHPIRKREGELCVIQNKKSGAVFLIGITGVGFYRSGNEDEEYE